MAGRGRTATRPAWMPGGSGSGSGSVPGSSVATAPAPSPRDSQPSLGSETYRASPQPTIGSTGGSSGGRASGAVGFSAAGFAPGDPRALIQAAMLNASMGTASADAVRRARRLYVGNVPPGTPDTELQRFFNDTISHVWQSGDHVVSAQGRPGFTFVELRDLSGASMGPRRRGRCIWRYLPCVHIFSAPPLALPPLHLPCSYGCLPPAGRHPLQGCAPEGEAPKGL